jgi:hypothetical protein
MLYAARLLCGAAALLALAALFLAPALGRDDDPDEKERMLKTAAAQKDVLKLLDNLSAKEDDVRKQAQDVAKTHAIKFVMAQFKPRENGGLGVGASAARDCIETEVLFLSKKLLTPDQLTTQKAELQKMAEAALTISHVAPNYAPKTDEPGMPIKDWMRLCDEMKQGSKDLIEAVKGDAPAAVKKSAAGLNSACESCHSEFRDK